MQQLTYKSHNESMNEPTEYVRVVDHCTSYVNSQPVDSYIYVEADKFASTYTHKFVLPITDFHHKYCPVLDELTLESLGDSTSLLDHIRQGQLFDIFGKYKLF